MSEEQMLVLRMLEEGKITADEAVGLLEALAQSRTADKTPSTLHRAVQEEERRARQAVREEVARAREIARAARVEAEKVKSEAQRLWPEKTWRALGGLLGGRREFSFERHMEGEFSEESPRIHLQNTNGRIELGRSPDQRWHLSLQLKVRADDEANAKAIADRLVRVDSAGGHLTVEARRLFGQNASVSMELLAPERQYSEICLASTNGSIQLANLAATMMVLKTVNGKVAGEKLQAEDLQTSSVNGAVTIEGEIERGQAQAANGGINVEITSASDCQLDLRTINGSIKVELPHGAAIGYRIDAATTAGSIKHNLPDLLVHEEQKRPGQRVLVAESPDFADKEWQQTVKARTVSGAIKINV